MQTKALVYNPLKHDLTVIAPDPGTATAFRGVYSGWHWFRDPWTGELRNDEDIENDPFGVKITPPGEFAEMIEAFKNGSRGKLQLMQDEEPGEWHGLGAEVLDVHIRSVQLVRNLIDPEMFGHAVPKEVRNAARRALGIASLE